jgi:hypothetical protein
MYMPFAIKRPTANADKIIPQILAFFLSVTKKPIVQDAIIVIHPIMLQIVKVLI